jgi:uncharacterized HAD superfamily protein
MACNPHFNQTVSEKQVSHTNTRKVIEIVSHPPKNQTRVK